MNVVQYYGVLFVSTSAADLIHYRRKKFGQIRAGGLVVANGNLGRASGFSHSGCINKSGVLFVSTLTTFKWLLVMSEEEEDESDLCIVETYGWVHLTSHNMHIADVTDHFLVHLWGKSPRFHGAPACQAFFPTFSTNNRIQGVCSVANLRGGRNNDADGF